MSSIVILHRNNLEFYHSDVDGVTSCPLSDKAVSDLEILDEKEVEIAVQKSLASLPKRSNMPCILVISDEFCFPARIEKGHEDDGKKQLVDTSPFVRVATTTVVGPKGAILIATNQDFYETIAKILQVQGYMVQMVIPMVSLVLINVRGPIDRNSIKHIFDSVGTLKQTSFSFQAAEIISAPVSTATPTNKKKKIPIWLVQLAFGAVIYALIMYWFFLR